MDRRILMTLYFLLEKENDALGNYIFVSSEGILAGSLWSGPLKSDKITAFIIHIISHFVFIKFAHQNLSSTVDKVGTLFLYLQ